MKKVVLILTLCLFLVVNVDAKSKKEITINDEIKMNDKVKNPNKGLVNLDSTIVPIILFGTSMILYNCTKNKNDREKNEKDTK